MSKSPSTRLSDHYEDFHLCLTHSLVTNNYITCYSKHHSLCKAITREYEVNYTRIYWLTFLPSWQEHCKNCFVWEKKILSINCTRNPPCKQIFQVENQNPSYHITKGNIISQNLEIFSASSTCMSQFQCPQLNLGLTWWQRLLQLDIKHQQLHLQYQVTQNLPN